MRNIHSDVFYCALALSEKNIRKNEKYCLETYQVHRHLKEELKMRIISKERLHHLREKYPVGCHVELLRMDDVCAAFQRQRATGFACPGTAGYNCRWW